MTYEIIEIYHHITDEIKNEIIDLWINNQALSKIEALNRINCAICAIVHIPSGKIIGVSTAKINFLPKTNDIYYYYGMFVDKEHRGGVGINWRIKTSIIEKTFNILKKQNNKYVKGLAAILENKKIPNKFLQRYGWIPLNDEQIEFDLLFKDFDLN
jgi:hypothetical protein